MAKPLESLSFLSAADADYIAELYSRYLQNPSSVDQSWNTFFTELDDDTRGLLAEMQGASWTPSAERVGLAVETVANMGAKLVGKSQQLKSNGLETAGFTQRDVRAATMDSVRALMLIRAYRVRGHLKADLDPLKLSEEKYHPELDPQTYGFTEADYDRPVFLDGVLGLDTATLRQILSVVEDTYCNTIGVEFMHIQDPEQKAWIQERIESIRNQTQFTQQGKHSILHRIIQSETFEQFLHKKYTGTKRFGLEGGEAMIPAIEQIMKRGGQLGVKEIVLGMAHRGRLNVLTNVMGKTFTAVFSEFQGKAAKPEDVEGSGDVKYHLGTSSDRDFDGNIIHLSLTANPSHLEAVNPVVQGKARAKQAQRKDVERDEVIGLLLHGDAALAGQGPVAETLMMSALEGYTIGGTIHFVINNQIGFTTSPKFSRSGEYATDVAKMIMAPIFHVNGDDPEAVVHVARIATEFRQKFKTDVFIDMICYRRHGHNEGDEPAFTQPQMYEAIKQHKTTAEIYAARLAEQGVVDEDEAKRLRSEFEDYLEEEFKAAENYRPNDPDMFEGQWKGLTLAKKARSRRGDSGVTEEKVQKVGRALVTVPDDFNLNSKIARQLKAKAEMFETGEGFDWATAEALAFGTLALEGFPVRLSGQDSGRGTFSQRHSVLIDQENGNPYVPLANIDGKQATFEVHDSPLSEAAVLGFEYGYSLAEPRALVLWEAQFGDFANGAQVIIDQFISSAETKWHRMSGLVMLLPHGYEGQGPEHSSARLERFLQLSAEDNWQIVNCTTPASYFHALRRQMHRDFRKPLVVMTPKSLLRHKQCVSPLSMMLEPESFHRVLYEDNIDELDAKKVERVILCSGKVYYDLAEARDEKGLQDKVTILRLEQIFPFPFEPLHEEIGKFPNADVVWCQEEPQNMGAWHFVDRNIEAVLTDLKHTAGRPVYAGRPPASSPATGLLKQHMAEQKLLVEQALGL